MRILGAGSLEVPRIEGPRPLDLQRIAAVTDAQGHFATDFAPHAAQRETPFHAVAAGRDLLRLEQLYADRPMLAHGDHPVDLLVVELDPRPQEIGRDFEGRPRRGGQVEIAAIDVESDRSIQALGANLDRMNVRARFHE